MRGIWSRTSRRYLGASVVLAVIAGLMMRSYLSHVSAAATGAGPQRAVVVAGERISRGSSINTSQLRVVRMPQAYAPPGSFERIEQAAGRVALSDLLSGEPVTQSRLARVRAGPVSSLIPEGLRAFAVPTSLPPRALAAGDHVDILGTYSQGQPHTESVVQGVEVLLVLGPSPSGGGSSGSQGLGLDAAGAGVDGSITLIVLVSPDQEERLAFARAFADLQVAIAPPAP